MSKEVEVIDKGIDIFSSMMVDLTDKLSSVIDKHGEGVADILLLYARVESAIAIFTVIALPLIIYVCYRIGAKLIKLVNNRSMAPDIGVVACAVISIGSSIAIILSVKKAFYGVVGIFYPEFWIAAKVISQVF